MMSLVPVITVILNLTNDYHLLFRLRFDVLETSPVRVFINERGPWFWVHAGYSYICIALAVGIVIYKLRGTARAQRLRYYMILLGSSLTVVSNLFVLFIAPNSPIDSTLWGATFGLFFMYFAMDTSPTSNYILARNQVFDAIGEQIFVLDARGNITDINRPAREWMLKYGLMSDPPNFNALISHLKGHGATYEHDKTTGQQELHFLDEENSLFSSYAIKFSDILDKKDVVVGFIVTFSDMTVIRETLRELQSVSAIDELTGTYNRRGYEKMLANYEEGKVLPLCIIMGDVNGLKKVNDTLGHNMGDQVLRHAAKILVESTGDLGIVARIGGDEFAVIVPGFTEIAAEQLLGNIKRSFDVKTSEMFGTDIALGYAIKTELSQDITNVIDEADKRMYQNKRNDRRRRTADIP